MNFATKKIFTLIIVAFVALILGLFLKAQFFRNDEKASAQTICTALTYASGKTSTEGVPVDGVENSGRLDFTKADADLAACAYKTNSVTSIKGLAWNTNLGWMSFEGASYSTLIFTDSGRVRGEAYGTNIGYIHMGCENGNNFSSSLDCTTSTGIKDYGVKVALADNENGGDCGTMAKGDLYGYAWTETVGWMNF
ncbi:MAG: hypothetical protein AAB739_03370, partial [Patescibacteria group bacterium]